MIENGLCQVDRGANPVLMREGIEKAAKAVSEYILSVSKKVESSKDIVIVATISSDQRNCKIIGDGDGKSVVMVLFQQMIQRTKQNLKQ